MTSGQSSPLNVLLDLEMPLTLRFGRARLHLEEIVNLEPNALLELDKAPHEPVEVLVNGRMVARGRVVEVQGNYGVQIVEVVSRVERMNLSAGAF
jgi:flagellar motor switch protein FliN/FliY